MSTSGRNPFPPDSVGKDDKDFAEHLRTVQFVLLVTCLGLIVVVTSPARTDIAIAHQQSLDILEIQKRWDPFWLHKAAERKVNAGNSGPEQLWLKTWREADEAQGPLMDEAAKTKAIEIEGQKFNVQFDGPSWFVVNFDKAKKQKSSGFTSLLIPAFRRGLQRRCLNSAIIGILY